MADEKKVVTITVNTVDHQVPKDEITFDEVVKLAYGSTANTADGYRVTYDRGEGNAPSGVLPYGGSIKAKDGMIFNVTPTGLS